MKGMKKFSYYLITCKIISSEVTFKEWAKSKGLAKRQTKKNLTSWPYFLTEAKAEEILRKSTVKKEQSPK